VRKRLAAGDDVDVGKGAALIYRITLNAFRTGRTWSVQSAFDPDQGRPQVFLHVDSALENFRAGHPQRSLGRRLCLAGSLSKSGQSDQGTNAQLDNGTANDRLDFH
jgi:hypothetical protein